MRREESGGVRSEGPDATRTPRIGRLGSSFPWRVRPLRAPVTALLLATCVACAPPVPEGAPETPAPDCALDADCAFAEHCVEGACEPEPGSLPSECTTSDDCLDAPLTGIPDLYWDGAGAVCTLAPDDCGPEGCAGRRVCRAPEERATRPGAVGCSLDAQCLAGHCVEHAGDHVCLKTCGGDADCAGAPDGSGARRGDTCAGVDVGESALRACVPAVAGRTLCRNDCDCAAADDCGLLPDDAPRCRFPPDRPALPGCERAPEGAGKPALVRCGGNGECLNGGCFDPCDSGSGAGALHFCDETPNRCLPPCGRDEDCPQRTQCREGPPHLRVGEWLLPQQKPNEDGRDVRFCQLPVFGCFDDQDCFPFVDGEGRPIGTWQLEAPLCKVSILRPATAPRAVTLCQPRAPALLGPGECCEHHEECDTAICAPAAPGGACATGFCTVPCDPTDDLDGLPNSGDERDRCAVLPAAPTLLPALFGATRCQPLLYERSLAGEDGTPRTVTIPVRVCR